MEKRKLTVRVEGVLVACGTCTHWIQSCEDEGCCGGGPISAGTKAAFGCLWWEVEPDEAERLKRLSGGLLPEHFEV